MPHLLHVDSSPRSFTAAADGHQSVSRMLTHQFVQDWRTAHPTGSVTYRDLAHQLVPPVDEAWIAAAYTPAAQRTPALDAALQVSDALIDELLAAEICVFGVPMYNFNVPSSFKAYIDQIVRVGRTFAIDSHGFRGLASGKKAIVITARGGSFRPGTPLAAWDHQEPFLRTVFTFIGITDIEFIHADRLNAVTNNAAARSQSLTQARTAIQQLALNL